MRQLRADLAERAGEDADPFRAGDLVPALLLAALGLVGLAATWLSMGKEGGQYIVLAAPWLGRAEMQELVARADGGVSGFGGLSSIAVAMSDGPAFADRLRAQGAWLVVPSPRLLGCFSGSAEAGK